MSRNRFRLSVALTLSLLCASPGCSRPDPTKAAHSDAAKQVTEIGIAHTPCFGRCPVYRATIRADGTVRYEGQQYVQNVGVRIGMVPKETFGELAQFVLDSGFMGLKDDYSKPETDHPSVITTVVAGGQKKVVRDYARAGPKELAEVEGRIDSLLSDVTWDVRPAAVKTQPSSP